MWCDINHKREVAVIGRASMHASDRKRFTGAWMERFFIQWSKCLHGIWLLVPDRLKEWANFSRPELPTPPNKRAN